MDSKGFNELQCFNQRLSQMHCGRISQLIHICVLINNYKNNANFETVKMLMNNLLFIYVLGA